MVTFLVIRFSSIGDIVLTSPVFRILKEQVPHAKIHFLTKEQYCFLVEQNPYIDKIHLLNDNWKELIEVLKNENFDHIIDLHHNLRTSRIKKALNIPAFTVDKLNLKKWLLVNLKINKLPRKHIVDRYIETLSVFDIHNDQKGLEYFTDEPYLYDLPEKYYALVIGGTYYTKQIPIELLINIIKQLDKPVVLLGGKEDISKSENLTNLLKNKPINLCGQTNLHQSAYVIKKAEVIITSDTGLMHIAAAYKKKIVSLWGNTVPEFGMTPYLPHPKSKIFEITDLSCRPCSKIGYSKCPKKHFKCMNSLNTSEITSYVKKIAIDESIV